MVSLDRPANRLFTGRASELRESAGEGTSHGSHQDCRRQQAQRHHSDFGRQERRPAADDRLAADRRHADAGKRAASGRCRAADPHSRQSRRRLYRSTAAAPEQDEAYARTIHFTAARDRRHHRALRTGVEDARQLLGDRPASGAHGRGARVAAGRLRHRHAAGRPVHRRAAGAGRRDRHRQRLCRRARPQRAQRRPLRLPEGLGRRHPRADDGRHAGQGRRPCWKTPRASPKSSTWPTASAPWAPRFPAPAPRPSHVQGVERLSGARHTRHPRPHRDRHLCHGRGHDRRRRAAGRRAPRPSGHRARRCSSRPARRSCRPMPASGSGATAPASRRSTSPPRPIPASRPICRRSSWA